MPVPSPLVTGNKGEWSEFYAFLKILTDGKVFSADDKLEPIPNSFLPVLEVVRNESQAGERRYELTSVGTVRILGNGRLLGEVDIAKVKSEVGRVFAEITAAQGPAFHVSAAEAVMADLLTTQLKASSGQKADLNLVIYDCISSSPQDLGFSVKSTTGGAATLLNASGATNFRFKVSNFSGSCEEVNSINTRSKVRDRLAYIVENGGILSFVDLSSDKFRMNLEMIDSNFPAILAQMLLLYYGGKGDDIAILTSLLPTALGTDRPASFYAHKIKGLLRASALGMVPGKLWDGFTKAHGGYIIVRNDGELVCYHMYNFDKFQDYLFKTTKFETPSTGKHGFGQLYEANGELFFNLNLQIRFLPQ